jgi:hypothetical protein
LNQFGYGTINMKGELNASLIDVEYCCNKKNFLS